MKENYNIHLHFQLFSHLTKLSLFLIICHPDTRLIEYRIDIILDGNSEKGAHW